MNTVRIQDRDGEWTAIGTTNNDGLVLNEPDPGDLQTLALPPVTVEIVVDLEAFQAALRAAAEAYVRIVPIAVAIVETLRAAAQAAEAYNPAPPPGRRRDRPAWQSPYGPPTRHHR